jgi:colicin import membrane protein
MKNELKNTEWDLHEENVIVPLEFTEDIKPEIFGLELVKAQEMTSGLSTTLVERQVLKDAYVDVIDLEITSETLPIFKELRLKIVKNRTQGIEKWHKTNKAFYLAGGRFVDAVKNKEIVINEEMEAKLMEAEKFFENQEKKKEKDLNDARIAKIAPYLENAENMNFAEFSDEDFDDLIFAKKTRFENEQKEREAEAKRIEEERLFEIARQKAIEEENARLKAEAEAKEIELQKERAEALAKQKAIQDEADKKIREEKAKQYAILEEQRKENARIVKELQDKKDAEIKAENERLAKIEADKKAAELAVKAPVKKQLNVWVNSFNLPECTTYNATSKEIAEKFEAFKKWAKNEVEKL